MGVGIHVSLRTEEKRMSRTQGRLLFWSPRILTIAFAIFLSLFALDVFNEVSGFWQEAIAFSIHLLPAVVVVTFLVIAWRWEWVGATLFAATAAAYAIWALPKHLSWACGIAGPLLVIAGLFLVNWFKRSELRRAA